MSAAADRAELLRRRLLPRARAAELPPRPERPPLSFAQQRVWFLDQLRPGSLEYVVPIGYHLAGPLDRPALERALAGVVARHEALRTRFPLHDGQPYQHVDAAWPGLAESAEVPAVEPFDLAAGPLFRAALVRRGPAEHLLLLTVHHAVFDGLSLGVLTRELSAGYRAALAGTEPDLPPLPMQYADYALWQRRELSGRRLERELAFWRTRLAGAPRLLELPADRPRPHRPSFRAGAVPATVPTGTADRLRRLARDRGASPFMVALAGYAALLGRYAGVTDVVVGCPVGGRSRPEAEELIGFFANTLPLRVDLSGDPTFGELVDRVRDSALAAYAHQELPFERLVEELAPDRDTTRNPIVQAWFNLLPGAAEWTPRLPGLVVTDLDLAVPSTRFDLELHLFDPGRGPVEVELLYATDLFDAATVERMAAAYRSVLAADPETALSRLAVTTAAELDLIAGWNAAAGALALPEEDG